MTEKRGILKRDIKLIEKEFGIIEKKVWKLIFHFPYRKLLILAILMIVAYILFRNPNVQEFVSSLKGLEYLGVFIAGILFTFGFTTPFAVGFFIVLNPANPLLVAVIGGIGSLLGDLLIFYIIRFRFTDEFERLEKTKILRGIKKEIDTHFSSKLKLHLFYVLAGLFIASPLPDEIGVTMLAGLTHIKPKVMMLISFVFNSLGILIMCLI